MRKLSSILIGVVLVMLGLGVGRLSAGSPDPNGGPTSATAQMYTLEQIYQRLNNGTAGTQMTTFTEPGTAPGTGTMHTLNDIMTKVAGIPKVWVPKTGQALCWDSSGASILCLGSGQDGEYENGSDPFLAPTVGTTGAYTVRATGTRFNDNGDGTVTDNLTTLIWLKNANCTNTVGGVSKSSGYLTWSNALTWSNNLTSGNCGLTDGSTSGQWRLPNVNELHSLIDLGHSNPALPVGHPFTGVQSGAYWSSSTYAPSMAVAWFVLLSVGFVDSDSKTFTYYVWPVRGGQ